MVDILDVTVTHGPEMCHVGRRAEPCTAQVDYIGEPALPYTVARELCEPSPRPAGLRAWGRFNCSS
jgi:hypothetical protein